MSKRKKADGSSRKNSWKINLIFILLVLAAAAALYYWTRPEPAAGSGLEAFVDFGGGVTETLPLDEDHDYLYEVDDIIVHLQVKEGAVAFLDSQCSDHVCEQFGWLSQEGAWAACVPAGIFVVVQQAGA